MEKNPTRNSLPDRLDIADLRYDIKRLSAEMDYHKSKAQIFDETIKSQQIDLENILGIRQVSPTKAGVYNWKSP